MSKQCLRCEKPATLSLSHFTALSLLEPRFEFCWNKYTCIYIYIYIHTFHLQMSLYKYWEILIFIFWASRSAHSAMFHLKHGSYEHWWYLMHTLSQDVLRRNSRWFAFMYTSGISHVIHMAYCSTVLRYWSCARWSFPITDTYSITCIISYAVRIYNRNLFTYGNYINIFSSMCEMRDPNYDRRKQLET